MPVDQLYRLREDEEAYYQGEGLAHGEPVVREDLRPDERAAGLVACCHDGWMAVATEDFGHFVGGKRAAEGLFALVHLVEQVGAQLSEDVGASFGWQILFHSL